MADDCSCLWNLTDTELLAHFEQMYLQLLPWKLCSHLTPGMHSALISALHRKQVIHSFSSTCLLMQQHLGYQGRLLDGALHRSTPQLC